AGLGARATVDGTSSLLKAGEVVIGGGGATGDLTISNGGTVDAPMVNVNEGGTLNGKKGVKDFKKSIKNNGGKVAVAPGPMNIGGSYTQLTGILEIDLTGPDQFAALNIVGY